MFKIKTQNNTFHFYYFNPLKSTQIGSNADRTDDFPPPKKPLLYILQNIHDREEYHTCWERGNNSAQHHNSITKKLPFKNVNHFTL